MICGRVTPSQRDIIKRRCDINTEDYKVIMNWLIDKYPPYDGMQMPEPYPQPIIIGGFNETINNTDQSEDNMTEIENNVDGQQMSFVPRNKPSESTGPYQSEKYFIFSHLRGQKPTLLFKRSDIIGEHTIGLVNLFPLNFPYG